MLNGKTILITGATSGIGQIAALELARSGAEVVIASRSASKCQATVQMIQTQTGNTNVSYIAADLSTLAGMRQAAETFLSRHTQLHVLLNNAGGLFNQREVTTDGYEMTLALNHLSYFVVTNLLLNTLKATAATAGEARIINVSSSAHYMSRGINFDDLQHTKRYFGFSVYSETKLMNVLFTNELARRLQGTNVTANSLHPGFVQTGFGKNNVGWLMRLFGVISGRMAITPEQGAQTSIHLAASPDVKGISGKYWTASKQETPGKLALDTQLQEKLWRVSEALTTVGTPVLV